MPEGIVTTQSEAGYKQENKNILGTYTNSGQNHYSIGIEMSLLKNPMNLIATIVHELSHLVLLGEGRTEENDEALTDLNCIALGFGILPATLFSDLINGRELPTRVGMPIETGTSRKKLQPMRWSC